MQIFLQLFIKKNDFQIIFARFFAYFNAGRLHFRCSPLVVLCCLIVLPALCIGFFVHPKKTQTPTNEGINGGKDEGKDEGKDDKKELTDRQQVIISLVLKNDKITIPEMIRKTFTSTHNIRERRPPASDIVCESPLNFRLLRFPLNSFSLSNTGELRENYGTSTKHQKYHFLRLVVLFMCLSPAARNRGL